MKKNRFFAFLLIFLLICSSFITAFASENEDGFWTGGCTNILVGKEASADGSVIGSYSCDGAIFAKTVVIPGTTHKKEATIPIYFKPYPNNYSQYLDALDNVVKLGEIPQVAETYRCIVNLVYYDEQNCGGINEHGVCIGETTIGGNRALRNPNGWMFAYSNFPESSLMTLGLQRAKTAREAVKIIGSLAEKYGYAQSGEHLTISDKNEVWAMEIFGAGNQWTPESGKPGAVWAAQRVPDGEIALSANSSRIGLIEAVVEDGEDFMNSSNTFTLAEELGLWTEGTPFIWFQVYGNRKDEISVREWSIINKFAPSLNAKPGDPIFFSFKPDEKVSVEDVMNMYRDYLNDTDMDPTLDEAYRLPNGSISPMASPFGPSALHTLLGISPTRSVATRTSVFTFVTQHKEWLPDPVGTCMWYTPGPAMTGCFAPIYAGTTELPDDWTNTPKTYVDRDSAWWAFIMVDGLSLIEWQNAVADIKKVRDAAEAKFLEDQEEVETNVLALYGNGSGKPDKKIKQSNMAAEKYVTKYTCENLESVSDTYWDLVDYLMFKYFFRTGKSIPITAPVVHTFFE